MLNKHCAGSEGTERQYNKIQPGNTARFYDNAMLKGISMLYAVICNDKPESLDLRMKTRPDHVAFLTDLNDRGILKMAGPFLNDNDKPCGSLVIIEADSKQSAREIAAGDPYAKAGLFAAVDIRPYTWTFNNPEI